MIYIINNQNEVNISEEQTLILQNTINKSLEQEKVTIPFEISLVFVNNQEIREINKQNRNIDKETDVLSFPMLSYPKDKVYKDVYADYEFDQTFLDDDKLILGDIVLSLEKALEQSKEYNHPFIREASYLVVHSVLHLLGYDHMEENEKNIMRKREEEILNQLNLSR